MEYDFAAISSHETFPVVVWKLMYIAYIRRGNTLLSMRRSLQCVDITTDLTELLLILYNYDKVSGLIIVMSSEALLQ